VAISFRVTAERQTEHVYPKLYVLAQDLIAAPASEAYCERIVRLCGDITGRKSNRMSSILEGRSFLKVNGPALRVMTTNKRQ